MTRNPLRRKLMDGQPILGTWIQINSPEVAEIVAGLGFDFVLFDLEHGAIDLFALQGLCQAVASAGPPTVPIARVPWNDTVFIKRVLEIGLAGIVVPMVKSADEAARAVAATRYPPEGVRSVGDGRANRWDLRYAEYLREANDDVLVVLQCEHIEAVKNLPGILAVPGIDVILIGPDDLAASLGLRGRTGEPAVQEAFQCAAQLCREAGVPVGQAMMDAQGVSERLEQGFQFLTLSTDYLALAQAFQRELALVRR
jgi:2-keto-3-deoxy-L-rhamnonate aldolase RhmA